VSRRVLIRPASLRAHRRSSVYDRVGERHGTLEPASRSSGQVRRDRRHRPGRRHHRTGGRDRAVDCDATGFARRSTVRIPHGDRGSGLDSGGCRGRGRRRDRTPVGPAACDPREGPVPRRHWHGRRGRRRCGSRLGGRAAAYESERPTSSPGPPERATGAAHRPAARRSVRAPAGVPVAGGAVGTGSLGAGRSSRWSTAAPHICLVRPTTVAAVGLDPETRLALSTVSRRPSRSTSGRTGARSSATRPCRPTGRATRTSCSPATGRGRSGTSAASRPPRSRAGTPQMWSGDEEPQRGRPPRGRARELPARPPEPLISGVALLAEARVAPVLGARRGKSSGGGTRTSRFCLATRPRLARRHRSSAVRPYPSRPAAT
jgi:hypothetical protein